MWIPLHRASGRALLALISALGSACVPSVPHTVPTPMLATRLVLAMDGIDYRDIMAARERGLFASFREPSRLISTFPSISDIAWHEIFRLQAPRGYQRIYFSLDDNEVVGARLDVIRPIEFEERMDMAFDTKFHHLGAYLSSNRIARREVDADVREFFKITGRSTVYIYNVGPDALQHVRGDLPRYLAHLDLQLKALQTEYVRRTGGALEIILLSDHGHNRAVDARFLPIAKALEARGFRTADRLQSPLDVAFSVDGVTNGFGVFAAPDSLPSLAGLLAGIEGVDIVSSKISDSVFVVRNASEEARIDRRMAGAREVYRYAPLSGDPLHYTDVIAAMRAAGTMDRDGFADAAAWVRATVGARYPAAVVRIASGHTRVTLNPAPILVSVADTYRVGLGMASIVNRLHTLGGSHGSLSETNSLGVVMSTAHDTHDDLTSTVHAQFGGFTDLRPVPITSAGARLTSDGLIGRDPRSAFADGRAAMFAGTDGKALEVWLTQEQLQWAAGRGSISVRVRRPQQDTRAAADVATRVHALSGLQEAHTPRNGWIASSDQQRYLVPLLHVIGGALEPNTKYTLQLTLDRASVSRRKPRGDSQSITTLMVRTNARGELTEY